MEALDLLLNRQSHFILAEPAPNKEVLQTLFKAALRSPDHGKIKPYHFTVIEKSQMHKLETILLEAIEELDLPPNFERKVTNLCTTSPMIIIVTAKVHDTKSNIPAWEKVVCAGCAAYAIQLAARAKGFESFWTSGWADAPALQRALNCKEGDQIVGFLRIGTKVDSELELADEKIEDYISYL